MTVPLWSLLGFVLWTLALVVLGIGATRLGLLLMRKAKPSEFRADVAHGSDRYRRLCRAHLNCIENLPIFATLVVLAHLIGVRSTTFDLLASVVLTMRVAQSLVHIASGSDVAVVARGVFYFAQVACWIGMAGQIANIG